MLNTVESYTMLQGSVMLKGLNKLQTICQIAEKLLLNGGKFISTACMGIHSVHCLQILQSKH